MNPYEIAVNWTCPHCKTKNLDEYASTAVPHCSWCEQPTYWDDILSPEEMQQHNATMTLWESE